MKKKPKLRKARIPMDAVMALRRDKFHSHRKGNRLYSRTAQKQESNQIRNERSD